MTGLPLALRLKRALAIALVLGLWAPIKIFWEQNIEREQNFLRYRGATITRQLRDGLSQDMTIGVLAGLRGVVADLLWLDLTTAWQNEQWFKMGGLINLCTALQPRSIVFWSFGGWQLAWNASVSAMNNLAQPNPMRRLKDSRFWIDRGLEIYLRGIANNPEHYRLWLDTGDLYNQRLHDYRMAAYYYAQAVARPDAPVFLERFPAYMYEKAGDDQAAYDAWKALWLKLTPAQRQERQHWREKIIAHGHALEVKLSIPQEKRIFPN